MSQLKLALLGTPQITLNNKPVTGFISSKAQALLIYLAVTARTHSRDSLATLLWRDMPQRQARSNLRGTLPNLRKLLGSYLTITRYNVAFNQKATYWLDVEELQRFASGDHQPSRQKAQSLDALYRGDFLVGFHVRNAPAFENWALMQREHFRELAVQGLDALVSQAIQHQDYEQGLVNAKHLLALEPWRESAHQQMMQLLTLAGHRMSALAQYETCRKILREAFDAEPTLETRQLFEQIKADKPRKGLRNDTQNPTIVRPKMVTPKDIVLVPQVTWRDMPHPVTLHGRQAALAQLNHWLKQADCALVGVFGMGGQGKTALIAHAIRNLVPPKESHLTPSDPFVVPAPAPSPFQFILWRTLINAPPLTEILADAIQHFSAQTITTLPATVEAQIALLIDLMTEHRCLLVLDNVESIMQGGEQTGVYRPNYEMYQQLLQAMMRAGHQSCLLLTSREIPLEVADAGRYTSSVRTLNLTGLSASAAEAILQQRDLQYKRDHLQALVHHYNGNPLALMVASEAIQDFYAGDVASFIEDGIPLFDDIWTVLDQQFDRLTQLEQTIMGWLAIEREPIAFPILWKNLVQPPAKRLVLDALRSLQRRSLIEKYADGFGLQNVVLEYVTQYLVDQFCQELETGQLNWFQTHTLMKAQSKDYVRASQQRLLVDSVVATWAENQAESSLAQRLHQLRQQRQADLASQVGYVGTNLFHLLLALDIDLHGTDFSGLSLRQAYLQQATLWNLDFTDADLSEASFTSVLGVTTAIAYSPNGRVLAVSTHTGEISIWRIADQQQQVTLTGHTGVVTHIAFSPNGRWLASSGFDATIRIWDMDNHTCMATLRGHTQCVVSATFSPDGITLISCSDDGSVRLWDLSTMNADIPSVRVYDNFKGRVRRVIFSPDGTLFATGGYDRAVRLWDVATGQCQQTLVGHQDEIKSLLFSPAGQTLISASKDSTVRIWDLASGQQRHVLDQHHLTVEEIAITPDGQYLASASLDKQVRLWDMQTGHLVQTFVGHSSGVKGVAFSPDGQRLASASTDQTIRVWDVTARQPLYTLMGHRDGLQTMRLSHDGMYLAASRPDPQIHFWHLQPERALPTHFIYQGTHTAMTFHPQQPRLAINEAGQIAIHAWQTDQSAPISLQCYLPGDASDTAYLRFSPDGHFLAGFGDDSLIRLWDLTDPQDIRFYLLQKHTRIIGGLAFYPDSSHLVGAGYDRHLYFWALSSQQRPERIRKIEIPRAYDVALGVSIHPNGRLLACGCSSAICLIDIPSGEIVDVLTDAVGWVRPILFSPDGQWLFSGDEDPKVQIWDVPGRKLVHNMAGHSGAITSLAYGADSQTLYSSSRDGTIKVWDVQTGQCQQTLRPKGPYAGLKIRNVKGLTEVQKEVLKTLGAVE